MRSKPFLTPIFCLLVIGAGLLLMSLPSDLEQFQSRCEQQYIVNEGKGNFDSHGQDLCNCLAANLSQEFTPSAFSITIDIFEYLSGDDMSALNASTEKLETNSPGANFILSKIIRYCHPHYGSVPDTQSIATHHNETIIGVGSFCPAMGRSNNHIICSPKAAISFTTLTGQILARSVEGER